MKTFWKTLLLLLSGLPFVFLHTPQARSQSADPLWTYAVPPAKGVVSSQPATVVVTPDRVVVQEVRNGSGDNRAYGLRRSDAMQVWQTAENQLGKVILSPLYSDTVVFFVSPPYCQERSTLAVDAQTGLTLWQTSGTDVCHTLVGVYESVTALTDTTGRILQLVNTRTGKKLDPKQDTDHALIVGEIARRGRPTIPTTVLGRPCLLDLNTVTLAPVPWAQVVPAWENPEITPGSAEFIGLATPATPKQSTVGGEATLIVRVDEDNGMAGHSLFPKYLVGLSAMGKHLWQYPTSVSPPDKPNWSDRIQAAWAVNSAGVAIAQTQNKHLSGVNIPAGKQIWQRVLPGMVAGVSVTDRGMFVLSISPTQEKREGNVTSHPFPVRRRLDYVDAKTGRVSHIANLTLGTTPGWYVTTSLSAVGEDVFVVTPSRVYAYNGRKLLQQVLPAILPGTSTRKQATAAINNRGQIVGMLALHSLRFHDSSADGPTLWENGKMRKLNNLTLQPIAINDAGLIAGYVQRGIETVEAEPRAASYTAPAVWQNGWETQLVTGQAFDSHTVHAINRWGQAVGDTNAGAFVWQSGKMLFLSSVLPPTQDWKQSTAAGINDRGQIVGINTSQEPSKQEKNVMYIVSHAFLLTPQP